MKKLFAQWFERDLVPFLFPNICRHCGSGFEDGHSNVLCHHCLDSIEPYQEPFCEHCGISLSTRSFVDVSMLRCFDCQDDHYHLDRVRAWGAYQGPLRILHHAFKFEGMEGLSSEIVDRWVRAISGSFWEGGTSLVPVPLSPEKERERGYNPSSLLALGLSRKTGLGYEPIIHKVRSTPPQMSLPRTKRLQNPIGAYAVVSGAVLPSKVILVDDVFTTGATLEECARILKKAGVQWVGAVVFGRTPHQT